MPAVLRRHGCLVLLAGLLILVAVAALVVRRALDPATMRGQAEARLSAALGRPVTIGSMSVSLFPPTVEGADIRIGDAAGSSRAPGVSLRAVRIRPRLSSVFSSPMVIEQVEVVGLGVDIRRDRGGRWLLPVAFPGGGQEGGAGATLALDVNAILLADGRVTIANEPSGAGAAVAPAAVRDIAGVVRASGGEVTLDALTATLGGSSLAGKGRIGPGGMRLSLVWTSLSPKDLPEVFSLLGATAPKGLAIEGEKPLTLDLTVDRGGRVDASGRLSASRASLDTLDLTTLEAPLRYSGSQLVLDPVTFLAYGGTHRGRIAVNTASSPVAWALDSRVEGVDVNRLVSANTTASGKIDGLGRIVARVRGLGAAPVRQTLTGTVVTELSNGVIHDFPILAAVRSALQVGGEEDKDLRFDSLSATWQVADARATTADFLSRGNDGRLTASGTLGFDQSLDFTGRLVLTKAKSDELVRRVRELQGLRNAEGEVEVPILARGTVGAPVFTVDVAALLGRAAAEELRRRVRKEIERFIK